MNSLHPDIEAAPHHNGAPVIDCRFARVSADTDTDLTVITIMGEIDASNVDDVSRHTRGLVPEGGALIVDLTATDFIAIDGLRMLFALQSMRPHRHKMDPGHHRGGEPATSTGRSRQATSSSRICDRGLTTGSPIRPQPPDTAG
jgi:hypothetical protein